MADPTASRVKHGTIFFPEISGAEYLPGQDRLVLVSDEHGLRFVDDAVAQLRAGGVTPRPTGFLGKSVDDCPLEDCEDAVFDGDRFLYVVTSHSRNRRGETDKKRRRLGRLEIGQGGDVSDVRHSKALWRAIRHDLPPLADASHRTPAQAGLNIEGLALAPGGELLIGLRSPTVTRSEERASKLQEDAIVLRVGGLDKLFDEDADRRAKLLDATVADGDDSDDDDDAEPFAGKATLLDLGGQGVRGLYYDRDRAAYWVLSGLSVDPNHAVPSPWALWLWDGSGQPQRINVPPDVRLDSPEAICLVPIDGRPHLLIVEDAEVPGDLIDSDEEPDVERLRDANAGCRYALVSTADLKTDSTPT